MMSLVFAKEECTQVLLDLLFVGRVSGTEEAESSEDKE